MKSTKKEEGLRMSYIIKLAVRAFWPLIFIGRTETKREKRNTQGKYSIEISKSKKE
jgi:hypothetical protein